MLFAFVRKGRAEAALEVLALTYKTFSSFLTGQCVEALILGSMFVIAMTLLRLPYALLTGISDRIYRIDPGIFGAFIGCAVGAFFLIFMVSPVQALIFIVLFLVLQQIEGTRSYPHVVGNSVGLPSIWVLVSGGIGGSSMGNGNVDLYSVDVSVLCFVWKLSTLNLQEKKIYPQDIGDCG